jgi:hypothetical protein
LVKKLLVTKEKRKDLFVKIFMLELANISFNLTREYNMINKINKERRRSMNATPIRTSENESPPSEILTVVMVTKGYITPK